MIKRKNHNNHFQGDFYLADHSRGDERRRYRRFQCRKGIITFLNDRFGRVVDISLGGLSFSSIVKKVDSAQENEVGRKESLDIIFGLRKVIASGLSAEIIYSYRIPQTEDEIKQNYYVKYYGVRFTDLSEKQDFKLKSIILKGCYFE